jgi:hypothetical protein
MMNSEEFVSDLDQRVFGSRLQMRETLEESHSCRELIHVTEQSVMFYSRKDSTLRMFTNMKTHHFK